MRLNLEQLKAMSMEEVGDLWSEGVFPFDFADCGYCLTQHSTQYLFRCREHAQVTRNLAGMRLVGWWHRLMNCWSRGQSVDEESVVLHLEELYAMRLFYDSLYPPAPAGEVAEAMTAEVSHAD